MEQLTLIHEPLPYKYIIDTSSILSQKDNEPHRRRVYGRLWGNIDELIKKQIIITCSEIKDEIKDNEILLWLNNCSCTIMDIDDEVQEHVKTVVTQCPRLIDFKNMRSSGDAFLIATAMKYSLTVITEENQDSDKKIPHVCRTLGVPCVNILGLCEVEGWSF